jgi:hypothetical protein
VVSNQSLDDSRVAYTTRRVAIGDRCGTIALVFAVSFIAAVAVRFFGLFPSVIVDWDESLYALMGDGWLHGLLPYRDIWDHHPPGLPALFAAILYVFPKSILAIRISACVAIAVTATALFLMGRTVGRGRVAGIVAAALYLAWTARLWGLPANTEIYLNALIASAMCLLVYEWTAPSRRQLARLCLGALLLGIAVQMKHVALAETAVFLAAAVVCRRRESPRAGWRAIPALGIGVAIPTLVALAYFASQGLLAEYVASVVGANLAYIGDRPSLWHAIAHLPHSLFIPIAVIALAIPSVWRSHAAAPLLVAAWAVAACVDIALPGQFWLHYFLLAMAPAAVLGGFIAAAAYRHWPGTARVAAPLVALAAAYPVGIIKDAAIVRGFAENDAPRAIADAIADGGGSGDYIFVLNYQPIVYFLADAKVPTRHAFPADWSERFAAVSGIDASAELGAVFANDPAFVVFVDEDWNGIGDTAFAAFKRHLARYEKRLEVVDRQILPRPTVVEVYQRRPNG